MWKCSICPQISSRKWNLEVHIRRLHKGTGIPIRLQYNRRAGPKAVSFEDAVIPEHHGLQSPTYVSTEPNKSQLGQKPDFVDDLHDFVFQQLPGKLKKWHELSAYFSLVGKSPPSDGIPQQWDAFYTYPPSQVIDDQNPLASQTSIFGFEAIACEKCLLAVPLDVIIVNGMGGVGESLVRSFHACDPANHISPKQLEELEQISTVPITENNRTVPLNEFYVGLLKDKCHEWIKNEVKLVSVKLLKWPKQSIRILAEPAKVENHWAVRAVQHSHTVLNDEELLEFLKVCNGRTFNVFEVNSGDTINRSNNYLLYVHWLPYPPIQIESMINKYL